MDTTQWRWIQTPCLEKELMKILELYSLFGIKELIVYFKYQSKLCVQCKQLVHIHIHFHHLVLTMESTRLTMESTTLYIIDKHNYIQGLFSWQPSFATVYAAAPQLVASKSTATVWRVLTLQKLWQPNVSRQPNSAQNLHGGHTCGVACEGCQPNSR